MQFQAATTEELVGMPPAFKKNTAGLPEKVFDLRHKLYLQAKREPAFRFYALYDRVYRKDVLAAAWKRVSTNDGAPGVDGVTIKSIAGSEEREAQFLEELQPWLSTPCLS